jgi:hypothetical protein
MAPGILAYQFQTKGQVNTMLQNVTMTIVIVDRTVSMSVMERTFKLLGLKTKLFS